MPAKSHCSIKTHKKARKKPVSKYIKAIIKKRKLSKKSKKEYLKMDLARLITSN